MHVARKKFWLWLGALAGGLALAVVLFLFAPEQYAFYPRCAFYALTGLKCPGCGGLRSAHHLLHGEFRTAFQSNALIVFLLPTLALAIIYYRFNRRGWSSVLDRPIWLWALLGMVISFAVIRNLPFSPDGW